MAASPPGDTGRRAWLTAAPFLVIAAISAVGVFIGLGSSSYWIDEMFTLFVVDHGGGLGEVLRRALTDTHPPAYYFLLHGWIQLWGSSEVATRSLSALFAVAMLPVLFFGLKSTFSLPARGFLVAMAASSKLVFEQGQNDRSGAMCALIGAILLVLTLAIHRRLAERGRAPIALTAGLWAVGLLGSFTHFYVFLAVGASYLFVLLSARTTRDRITIVVTGLSIAALLGVYILNLLHGTKQNLGHMWFTNKIGLLSKEGLNGLALSWSWTAVGAVVLLLLAPWFDRARASASGDPMPAPPRFSLTPLSLSALVILGTVAGGLTVSFVVAPSFGSRNLIVLGPYLWTIAAWVYETVSPDPRRRGLVLLVALVMLMAGNAMALRARPLPREEDWRGSAAYVDGLADCKGQPIPVILPFIFGPATPFFRDLAQYRFFGRYEVDPSRLRVYTPEELTPGTEDPGLRTLLRQRIGAAGGCPVLAWGVHDLDKNNVETIRRDLADTADVAPGRIVVRTFYRYKVGVLGISKRRASAYVFERAG